MTNVLAMGTRQGVNLRKGTAQPPPLDALSWLKRLWPLLLLVVAAAVVLAMGWQSYLSVQQLAENRDALGAFIDANMALALLAFIALYTVTVALSVPGAAVLTLAGGLLFGWLLGGIASMIGATLGAVIVFLIARSALSEVLAARAGPWLDRFREGFKQDAFNYLLFLRTRADLPLLAGESGSWTARGKLRHLSHHHYTGHHPGNFRLLARGQRPRQYYRRAAICSPILPCQDGTGRPRVLPVCARSWGAFDAGADCWARGAWARRPRAGRGQVVQAEGGLRGQG